MASRRTGGVLEQEIRQLRKYGDRYYLSADDLIEGVEIADREQKVVYVNPALCEMLGYQKEELVGRAAVDLVVEDDRGRVLEQVTARKDDAIRLCEIAWKAKDNHSVSTIVSSRPIFDRDGRFQGSLAFLLQTTERKCAPRSYRTLAENLPGTVYRLPMQADAPVEFFNQYITRITGYSLARIRRSAFHPIYSLILKEHRRHVRLAIRAAVAKMSPFQMEYGIRDRSGNLRYLLECGRPVAEGGDLSHIDGFIVDITEQKGRQQSVRTSEGELRWLSKQLLVAQEEERARIAQELHDGVSQSLVGALVRLGRLAQQSRTDEGTQSQLADVISIVQQATEELQRISTGLRPSILDDLGLLPTLAWLCRQIRAITGDLDLLLDVDLTESDVPQGVATQIYRIAQEGLRNVFQHAGATQAVVRLSRIRRTILLEISDDGAGFDLQAVMKPGARTDPARSFGLRSMRQRATLSGGMFTVRSAPGHGTVIRIEWPMDPATF